MTVPARVLRAALTALAGLAAACAGPAPGAVHEGDAASAPAPGELQVTAVVPSGVLLDAIDYSLTNDSTMTVVEGTLRVGVAGSFAFTIANVAAGNGFGLSLVGVTADGGLVCSFPAQGARLAGDIAIESGKTTDVSEQLVCVSTYGNECGCILENAPQFYCPVWSEIVATRVRLGRDAGPDASSGDRVGGAVFSFGAASPTAIDLGPGEQLILAATAAAPHPDALAFSWGSTGGKIVPRSNIDPTDGGLLNEAVFTCPPGPATTNRITLTLSDGPVPEGGACDPHDTTATLTVACSAEENTSCDAPCDGAPPDAGD
jgi:hypothetical protein